MPIAPTYAPTGVVRRGSRFAGMTEEIAPVAGRRSKPLVGQVFPKTRRPLGRPQSLPHFGGAAPSKGRAPNQRKENPLDAHCRISGCGCTHQECYRGWRDTDDSRTTPCDTCRPHLHGRWLRAYEARLKGYPMESVHRILRGQ